MVTANARAIFYSLRLDAPVLVEESGGDPASAISRDWLPGSAIRGAVIGLYAAANGAINPADPVIRRRFFDGSVRFLAAYPLDQYGDRMLPTPHSWFAEKADGAEPQAVEYFDLAVGEHRLDSPQSPPKRFCRAADGRATIAAPERRLRVHTARDPKRGRAAKGTGNVFRYESLAPGQLFGGAILCDAEEDAQALAALTLSGTTFWIGRSEDAEYGKVTIEQCEVWEEEWPETPGSPTGFEADSELVVTLLSDGILPNAVGCPAADLETVARAISRVLGPVEPIRSFLASTITGGFNRTWGLPLPQETAIALGSVVVLRCLQDVPATQVEQLLWEGIGRRRAEGFGRVAVGWQGSDKISVGHGDVQRVEPDELPDSIDEDSRRIAGMMVQRMLSGTLEERIAARPQDWTFTNLSGAHQLASLRLLVRQALAEPSTQGRRTIQAYLEEIGRRETPRTRLGKIQIVRGTRQVPLLSWIRTLLADQDQNAIWGELGIDRPDEHNPVPRQFPALGAVRVERIDDLALHYALRLIDAVLERAMKQARKAGA